MGFKITNGRQLPYGKPNIMIREKETDKYLLRDVALKLLEKETPN